MKKPKIEFPTVKDEPYIPEGRYYQGGGDRYMEDQGQCRGFGQAQSRGSIWQYLGGRQHDQQLGHYWSRHEREGSSGQCWGPGPSVRGHGGGGHCS